MSLESKSRSIRELVDRLSLHTRGWAVVNPDPWESDTTAIALSRVGDARRLVYVSNHAEGRSGFYYECEVPTGEPAEEYRVADEGVAETFDALVEVLIGHLGKPEATP